MFIVMCIFTFDNFILSIYFRIPDLVHLEFLILVIISFSIKIVLLFFILFWIQTLYIGLC